MLFTPFEQSLFCDYGNIGVEVSDLCRREGINPTLFYGGKKKLLSGAVKIFDESASRPPAEAVQAYEALLV